MRGMIIDINSSKALRSGDLEMNFIPGTVDQDRESIFPSLKYVIFALQHYSIDLPLAQ